ncbi:hypothetical protein DMP15_18205 [Pseudonocardia sp. UM4_GMWB1]
MVGAASGPFDSGPGTVNDVGGRRLGSVGAAPDENGAGPRPVGHGVPDTVDAHPASSPASTVATAAVRATDRLRAGAPAPGPTPRVTRRRTRGKLGVARGRRARFRTARSRS